jgi:hypothetical protein
MRTQTSFLNLISWQLPIVGSDWHSAFPKSSAATSARRMEKGFTGIWAAS